MNHWEGMEGHEAKPENRKVKRDHEGRDALETGTAWDKC